MNKFLDKIFRTEVAVWKYLYQITVQMLDGALFHCRYKDHLRTEIFATDAELSIVKESSQEHGIYSWCNVDKIPSIQCAQYITSATNCHITCQERIWHSIKTGR